jgi:hypothetical protein
MTFEKHMRELLNDPNWNKKCLWGNKPVILKPHIQIVPPHVHKKLIEKGYLTKTGKLKKSVTDTQFLECWK